MPKETVKYFKRCDLCGVGTGISRQLRPIKHWDDEKVEFKWVWVKHREKGRHVWGFPVIRNILIEREGKRGLFYDFRKFVITPQHVCKSCFQKLGGKKQYYVNKTLVQSRI